MNKYEKLTKAAARAVETLVHTAAMMDAAGAVSFLLKTEPRIWNHLPEDTLLALEEAYGLARPHEAGEKGAGE